MALSCVLTGKVKASKLKGEEVASIDQVTVIHGPDGRSTRANITMRIPRSPYIGDKFSSRHGQKGVLSQQYPDTDLPFCAATGMRCAGICARRWGLASRKHLQFRLGLHWCQKVCVQPLRMVSADSFQVVCPAWLLQFRRSLHACTL